MLPYVCGLIAWDACFVRFARWQSSDMAYLYITFLFVTRKSCESAWRTCINVYCVTLTYVKLRSGQEKDWPRPWMSFKTRDPFLTGSRRSDRFPCCLHRTIQSVSSLVLTIQDSAFWAKFNNTIMILKLLGHSLTHNYGTGYEDGSTILFFTTARFCNIKQLRN